MNENKNILIKIWGSLLAPKNSQKKDFKIIKFLSKIIKKFPDKNFFIINWTWNIWHTFVQENFLNEKNIFKLQWNLKKFFSEIDEEFFKLWIKKNNFKRFETNKIYLDKENFFKKNKKFEQKINIFWWDILKDWKIISSDKIFWDFINFFNEKWEKFDWFFAWDTNWIYDKSWLTIEKIYLSNFEKINFTEKKWDVTWWMKNKFLELIWKKFDEIIIFNWLNLNSWKNIFLKTWENKDFTKILY